MDRSLDRTRGVVSAAAVARAERKLAIVAAIAAQTIGEGERWWTVMASSSPACVVRVVTTGGEKDVQSETQPALADPIARVWFALEEVAGVRQGFGRFRARNSSQRQRRHRHNYTSDRG